MDTSYKINKMDHMGLSYNVKCQVHYAIIQISHPTLGNSIKHVSNNLYEYKKVLSLKGGIQIDVHFVQIYLTMFNSCYVITHEYISTLHKFHQAIHIFQHRQNTWQA